VETVENGVLRSFGARAQRRALALVDEQRALQRERPLAREGVEEIAILAGPAAPRPAGERHDPERAWPRAQRQAVDPAPGQRIGSRARGLSMLEAPARHGELRRVERQFARDGDGREHSASGEQHRRPRWNTSASVRAIARAASRSSSARSSSRLSASSRAVRCSRSTAPRSCRRMRSVSVLITTPTANSMLKVSRCRASETANV
jgi:hypothetical protein